MTDDAERERLRLRLVQMFCANVPHNRALGIEIVEATREAVRFRLPYDPKLVGNPDSGVLHGGAITALLDGTSGCAVFAVLTELVPIATLDLRIDYLRPAEAGRAVLARATCYKRTRNVAFTRAVAYHDDPEDPIAHSVGTFMVSTKPGGGGARP
ncbi:MAG TPA: PaaI family thioesterase [Kofleriaceae bacterium]|nr:PaaI family thioesterase [Kofleriaceae bacterium]